MIEVKFLKSASCAPFYLSYSANQFGHVTPEMAELLIKAGFAETVAAPAAPAQEEPGPEAEVVTKDKIVATKPKRGRRKHK